MQRLTRLVVAAVVSAGIATLTGCSWFRSADCSGETEERLLSQILVESGAPGAALLGAFYGNNLMVAALSPAATNAELVPVTRGIKSLVSSGSSAFDFQTVITTEKKSRRSVVCIAEAHFAAAPPTGFPTDEQTVKTWRVASETHWSLAYTAQLSDKGDEVLVKVESAPCKGPGCEVIEALKPVSLALQGEMGDKLLSSASAPAAQTPPSEPAPVATSTTPAQPSEGIIEADCEVVRNGQTLTPTCEAVRQADGTFNIRNPMRSSALIDGILEISVEAVETGHEVRILTATGYSSWGAATRESEDSSCWLGSDFRVCARPKGR